MGENANWTTIHYDTNAPPSPTNASLNCFLSAWTPRTFRTKATSTNKNMGAPVSPNIANLYMDPDSKVHGANMGPIWGRQVSSMLAPGPRNLAIWGGVRNQGHAHSPELPTPPPVGLPYPILEVHQKKTGHNFQKPRSRGLPKALQNPALHPYVGDTVLPAPWRQGWKTTSNRSLNEQLWETMNITSKWTMSKW